MSWLFLSILDHVLMLKPNLFDSNASIQIYLAIDHPSSVYHTMIRLMTKAHHPMQPQPRTTGPDDEDAKLPQVPVSVHAAQHKVNAANAPPPSALQPVDVKSTGTSDGHGMKEIMTELHRISGT